MQRVTRVVVEPMKRKDVSRRTFVAGTLVAAGCATSSAAGVAAAPPSTSAAPAPGALPEDFYDPVPFGFDAKAFGAVLDQPFPHRQVVAATTYVEGTAALAFMENTIKAYIDPMYFHAGPKSVHAAAVFYHGASVLLALDDAMWAKYPLAESTAMPGAPAKSDAVPARSNGHAAKMKQLLETYGASYFVCNNALSGLAGEIAAKVAPAGSTATRAQVVAIHDEFVAHFLPGVLLVPAGVAAINAAQEARFTFLRA